MAGSLGGVAMAGPAHRVPGSGEPVGRPTVRASVLRPLSLASMAIGDERRGIMTVTNAGSARLVLGAKMRGSRVLGRQLQLSVLERRRGSPPAIVYEGPLVPFGLVEIGDFDAGERRSYAFRVRLSSTGSNAGDNALQGLGARLTFQWTAVQSAAR